MPKSKIIREIVSPEKRAFGDTVERTRTSQREQLQEQIRRSVTLLKPDGGVDVANEEAQKGRVLQRADFIRRIKKLYPNLWYEQSIRYPSQGGIYIDDPRSPYGKRMVAGMPHDVLYEFSVVVAKPSIIPDPVIAMHWQKFKDVESKRPGWRDILFRLLKEGLVTATAIDNEFHITQGRSSQRWQEATA